MSTSPCTQTGTCACGCCEGIATHTPAPILNRPGLSAIAYRVGTHAKFKQSMLARLSAARYPVLSSLRTRKDDDLSIALLDAWATIADILTFYQERIANESYLRTSRERLSLLQMARLIGYQLSLGVAASAHLAFTMETAEGSPKSTTIDVGVKVNSTPGPDEKPQSYETIEKIEARPKWNAIKPRLGMPTVLSTSLTSFYLEGLSVDVKKGDVVLIVAGTQTADRVVKRVKQVTTLETYKITKVDLEEISESAPQTNITVLIAIAAQISGASGPPAVGMETGTAKDALFSTDTLISDSAIESQVIGATWKSEDLLAMAAKQGWLVDDLAAGINAAQPTLKLTPQTGIFVFRQRGNLFGYTAPKKVEYTGGIPKKPDQWSEWDVTVDAKTAEASDRLFLDNAYDKVVKGGYVAIQKPGEKPKAYLIDDVVLQPRTDYGISSKSTLITLPSSESWWTPASEGFPVIRNSMVYLESEQLKLAQEPLTGAIDGQSILLNDYYPYLKSGRVIVVTGTPANQAGVTKSEIATVASVELTSEGFTKLNLAKTLKHSYERITVKINANVALASHGETVSEVLGSGDASQVFTKFALRQPPLTHISASTPSGTQSTLEVRVNDVLWREVNTLYGAGSNDPIFITRVDDEGNTTVQFGDGVNGRLLPTGSNNVHAKYRKGIGLQGLVKAKQLDQLLTKPLGVKEVINPLDASGADDPETLSGARENAPLTVLTLDRIVSLQDYQDFARAFAGIAKALANWIWDGRSLSVFITVAGPKGAPVTSDSTVYENLVEAIRKAGDPYAKFKVKTYRKAFFRLHGTLLVDPTHLTSKVLADVQNVLRSKFSFEARAFGQGVALSEVSAVIQGIKGVISVDIDKLFRTDDTVERNDRLAADLPKPGASDEVEAAELLTLDSAPLDKLEATT